MQTTQAMIGVSWLGVTGLILLCTSPVVSEVSYLAAEPYKDILSKPDFKPRPEVIPNKTIDQLITEAYGGLNMYMKENFLDPQGDITVELDLVLTPDQFKSLYRKVKQTDSERGRYKRKATRPLASRWTDRVMPYEFVYSHFSVDEIYYIQQAMQRWENMTCLTFKPFTQSDSNRIRFQNGYGCNSYLGMVKGVQPINLQSPGCRFSGLYLHEIGHAIGLVHEHQLPDRDQYIRIIYDNVAPSMRIWFNKYSIDDVNQYGVPYEYSSVMHYGVTAFSKDGSSRTIQTLDPSREREIGRVYLKGLSFTDIKVVNLMYDCNKHCAPDPKCPEPAYLDKNCKCVRPEDINTGSVTSSPTVGDCSNIWNDGQCDGWAEVGECDNNPFWMKENCKKSCKVCSATGKPVGDCSNIWNDGQCDGWAEKGECDNNPLWMKENCKKSCKVCSATGKPDVSPCKNSHNDEECDGWANHGECDNNPSWMKINCKKSCSVCDGTDTGSRPVGDCSNIWNDGQCDGWAEKGECDNNPLWMKENCKKSCKVCSATGKPETCVDNNKYCDSWSRNGYCANNWFTQENCKKSCGRCPAREEVKN